MHNRRKKMIVLVPGCFFEIFGETFLTSEFRAFRRDDDDVVRTNDIFPFA